MSTATATATATTGHETYERAVSTLEKNATLQACISQACKVDKVTLTIQLHASAVIALHSVMTSNNKSAFIAALSAATGKNGKIIINALTNGLHEIKGFQSPGKGQTFSRLSDVDSLIYWDSLATASGVIHEGLKALGVKKELPEEITAARKLAATKKENEAFEARCKQEGFAKLIEAADTLSHALERVTLAVEKRELSTLEHKSLTSLLALFAPLPVDPIPAPAPAQFPTDSTKKPRKTRETSSS